MIVLSAESRVYRQFTYVLNTTKLEKILLTVKYTWKMYKALVCGGRAGAELPSSKISREIPQPVVAHQVAKFNC